MPSVILDGFGRPAQLNGGGQLYARSQDDARLRPPPGWHFDDYISLLSAGRWKNLVSESRAIGSKGMVSAAIAQKADYVSASKWRPFFMGEDSTWGEQAEALLEETTNLCCTRGPRYDWRTFWRTGVISAMLDGGFFILLTEGRDGWPLLQPLEAHRIGMRGGGASGFVGKGSAFTRIKRGDGDTTTDLIETPYVGLRIINGVIYNQAGCEVAFRVLGETPDSDEDISARDMVPVGAPRWFSEGRPIPQIAPALLDLLGVDMARSAQLDQQVINSKLTLIETNETGRRDPVKDLVNPPFTQPTLNNTAPEVIERGHIRYVKQGGNIQAHKSDTPGSGWMEFDLRTAATAIAAIGWRLEMLDPSALRGAATRAFQDQVNTLINNTFAEFEHAVTRCTRYRVSKHILRGDLPAHKEFLRWAITPPPEFVVDRNSTRIDIEAVAAGADAMPFLHRRAGNRPRAVLTAQARYVKMKKEIAEQYGVSVSDLGTMDLSGNDNADKSKSPTSIQSGLSQVDENGNEILQDQNDMEARQLESDLFEKRMNAYGTAVRAGVITPNIADEAAIRAELGLPAVTDDVRAAWKEDGYARKPITLQGQKENAAQARAVASDSNQ